MPWSIIFEWWIGSIFNLKRKMAKIIGFRLSKYDNECLDKCSCFIFFIRLWSIHNCYLSFLQWEFYFFKVFFFIIFFCSNFLLYILNVVFRRSYFPWYFCTGIVSWRFLRKNWLQWLKISRILKRQLGLIQSVWFCVVH